MVSDFCILDSEVLKLLPVAHVVLCTSTELVPRTIPCLSTGTASLVARQQLLYPLPEHGLLEKGIPTCLALPCRYFISH